MFSSKGFQININIFCYSCPYIYIHVYTKIGICCYIPVCRIHTYPCDISRDAKPNYLNKPTIGHIV